MEDEGAISGPARKWRFGWCEYLEISRSLFVHGKRSELRGKPLDVLQLLLKHADIVVPKETLMEKVWGNASGQSLTVAISKLRKAFGGEMDALVQNVASIGYRMAVSVECLIADAADAPLLLQPGQPIPGCNDWRAVARLGGPDHGPVWLAEHTTGHKEVYKFATDGLRLRALQREAAVAKILKASGSDPVSQRRIGRVNFSHSPYFTAGEYLAFNLRDFLHTATFRGMDRTQRLLLMIKLAGTVAAAHAVGVLHNDIKPSNVLVRILEPAPQNRPASERYVPILIDFGESSLLGGVSNAAEDLGDAPAEVATESQETAAVFRPPASSSGPGTIGSEIFRAPELREGAAPTVEADVYSLGVILYQVITGTLQHGPSGGWQQDVSDALLEEIVARAAHGNPNSRFRSVAALVEALASLDARREELAQQQQREARLAQAERDLDRARAARPWIFTALALLAAGVVVSGLFYRTAARERNAAESTSRSLQTMLAFLTQDVLAQANPAYSGSGAPVDLTLSAATLNAAGQIDQRFAHDAATAGRLHETIADSLRGRTLFTDADREYAAAAKKYLAAEGWLSQQAIAAELKRDATGMVGLLPGAVARARSDFDQEQKLIARLQTPSPKVLVLRDFVESGLLGLEGDPAKGVPPLQRAIKRAEATPGFDPMLLLWIKGRYCGLYVHMGDGPHLESAARERIAAISAHFGADSPMLVSYEMYLQEAFFLQGKFRSAVEQADRNYPRFQRLVGERSQYTLAVLANRAASLAQLGQYPAAVSDDLRLSQLAADQPSGVRLRIGSLQDAAMFACRSGQYTVGLNLARQVLREAAPGPSFMPAFFNAAKFVEAECTLGKQEAAGRSNPEALRSAEALLRQVDSDLIEQQTGESFSAYVRLGEARIAMMRKDRSAAAEKEREIASFFSKPGSDPYEKGAYGRLAAWLGSPDMGTTTR